MSRMSLIVASIAVGACSGASAAVPDTASANPPLGADAAVAAPCPDTPDPPACPEPPKASLPDKTAVRSLPGLSGFFCVAHQEFVDKPDVLTEECFRTDEQCKDLRDSALEQAARAGECRRADRAFCFQIYRPRKMVSGELCFIRREDCARHRDRLLDKYSHITLERDCRPAI